VVSVKSGKLPFGLFNSGSMNRLGDYLHATDGSCPAAAP